MDKGHGRIEQRKIVALPVDGFELGLPGAAQICRINKHTDYLRGGRIYKTSDDTRYFVTTLNPEEAGPQDLLNLLRGYWKIEICQHYRRDHTQREDHCHVRNSNSARVLSLMRSLAIFLYQRQRNRPKGKKSLPDWQAKNHRNPNPLIDLITKAPS